MEIGRHLPARDLCRSTPVPWPTLIPRDRRIGIGGAHPGGWQRRDAAAQRRRSSKRLEWLEALDALDIVSVAVCLLRRLRQPGGTSSRLKSPLKRVLGRGCRSRFPARALSAPEIREYTSALQTTVLNALLIPVHCRLPGQAGSAHARGALRAARAAGAVERRGVQHAKQRHKSRCACCCRVHRAAARRVPCSGRCWAKPTSSASTWVAPASMCRSCATGESIS